MKSVLIMAVVAAALTAAAPALAAPPPNDAFADAQIVTTLPYTDSQQIGEATTEPGEQQWCSFSSQTIWYAFTPSSDGFLVAATRSAGVEAGEPASSGGGVGSTDSYAYRAAVGRF